MQLKLCSNAYGDVADFEICGFHKNAELSISRERNTIFLQIKKFISYKSRAMYVMAKNSFVAELTFKYKFKLTFF